MTAAMAQSVKAFASHAESWMFECQSRHTYFANIDRAVVTAPFPNAQQQTGVSWVFVGDRYKWMPRVTVGVAR